MSIEIGGIWFGPCGSSVMKRDTSRKLPETLPDALGTDSNPNPAPLPARTLSGKKTGVFFVFEKNCSTTLKAI